MFTKVTTVLLIASVAFAAHVSFSENVGAKIDDDLVKLGNAINATIKKAGQQFIKDLTAFNRTAIQAENGTASALITFEEANQKDLDALKAKAKAANVNIDECLGQDEATLLNLTKAFEMADIRCVRGRERRVVGEANVTFHRILQTERLAFEIKGEIEKCDKKEPCLQKLEKRIERETVEIPQRVEREVKRVSTNMETIQTAELRKCGNVTLQRAETKGKALLLKITTCVNGKLKN